MRGANPKNYVKHGKMSDWFIRETLEVWSSPDYSTQGKRPVLSHPYKKYITIGNALASPQRWKLAGRWSPPASEPNAACRLINIAYPGDKRELLNYEPDWLSTPDKPANRCLGLIRTRPTWNDDETLSRPRTPDWLDEDTANVVKDAQEQAEVAAGFD
jgi:hypothetical protein